jgi:starvation-inducible DNA-binding protein
MTPEIGKIAKQAFADSFLFYLQAHYYHWNVEGPDFVQYHDFLGETYQQLFAAVDVLAEEVRALDSYAPAAHRMLMELTKIQDDNTIPGALEMMRRLQQDNDTVMEGIVTAYMSADAAGELGLANLLQDRLDIHKKLNWMLRSITK